MLILRLAADDVAVRYTALEEALVLSDAELALVAAIDVYLSSWGARGTMLRQGDRLYRVVRVHVDDTVTRLATDASQPVGDIVDWVVGDILGRAARTGRAHPGIKPSSSLS